MHSRALKQSGVLFIPKIYSEGEKKTFIKTIKFAFFFSSYPYLLGTSNDTLPLHARQLYSPMLLLSSFWHLKQDGGGKRHLMGTRATHLPAGTAVLHPKQKVPPPLFISFWEPNGGRTIFVQVQKKVELVRSFLSLFLPSVTAGQSALKLQLKKFFVIFSIYMCIHTDTYTQMNKQNNRGREDILTKVIKHAKYLWQHLLPKVKVKALCRMTILI